MRCFHLLAVNIYMETSPSSVPFSKHGFEMSGSEPDCPV